MREHKIKIISESIEQFKMISDKLQKLPTEVYNQIETARWGALLDSVECVIPLDPGFNEVTYALPHNTKKIANFGEYMGIYIPGFFFRIEENKFQKLKEVKINYVILDEEDLPKDGSRK